MKFSPSVVYRCPISAFSLILVKFLNVTKNMTIFFFKVALQSMWQMILGYPFRTFNV